MAKIIFSTNESFFAKSIRLLTKSKASHVAMLYNKSTISHSTFLHGVTNEPLNQFKQKQTIVKVFEIPDPKFKQAQITYKEQKNKIYGYFDIIYTAIAIALKHIIKFKNPIQDGLICSEYISLYMDRCLNTKINSSSYPPNPQTLLEYCEANLKETTL